MSLAGMQHATRVIAGSNIGYNQARRWTFYDRLTKRVIAGQDADCSSLCGAIAHMAGYNVDLFGTFYTGNFEQRLVATGKFRGLAYGGLGSLQPGDFVLSPQNHVEFVYSNDLFYSAAIDENGNITGGRPGNQSGVETRYKGYYTYWAGWQRIVRPIAPASQPIAVQTIQKPKTAKDKYLERKRKMIRGMYYNNGNNTWIYVLFNTESGWYSTYSNGAGRGTMPGEYNNRIARNWETGSFSEVTKGHAENIMRDLALVRQGK